MATAEEVLKVVLTADASGMEAGARRGSAAIRGTGDEAEKSLKRIQNATRNLGYQFSDVGSSLAGGSSFFMVISQQAPQVMEALRDIRNEGAALGTVLQGVALPGALALASVLATTLIPKLLATGDAEKVAEGHLHDFANAQVDLGRFIDQTTGKLIAQNAAMARNRAALIPAQITAANAVGQGYVDQAFAAARDVAGRRREDTTYLAGGALKRTGPAYTGNSTVGAIVEKAGSNGGRLFKLLAEAAKANPADRELQKLVATTGDLSVKMQDGAERIRTLKNEGAQLATAINNGTVATKGAVDANIRRATATDAVSKAQSHLADVETRWAQIDAMPEGDAKRAAVAKYTSDMVAATKAVEGAQTATKAHNKAISEGEREAKRQAAVWDKIEIATRNIGVNLGKIKGLDLNSLGLGDWKDKPREDITFDEAIGGARDRVGDQQDASIAARSEALEKFQSQQESNVRTLADLYESAFTGAGGNIAEAFKREMSSAIATALARFAVTGKLSFGSGSRGGGVLGLISSLIPGRVNASGLNASTTSSLSSINSGLSLSALGIGRASGGYVAPYSVHPVNEAGPELLRMGGAGGQIIPLGGTKAAMGGGMTVLQTLSFDMSGAVLTSDLLAQMNAMANAAAVRGASGGSSMAQANFARRARYTLG